MANFATGVVLSAQPELMETMIHRFSSGAALLATIAMRASAQTPVPATSTEHRATVPVTKAVWIELGAGVGKSLDADCDGAISASVDWQEGARLLSVRGDGVATGWSSAVGQFALLLGRASTRSDGRFAAASAGIAFTQATVCIRSCGLFNEGNPVRDTRNTIGVVGALKGALRAGSRGGVGIGLTMFVNANSVSSFGGLALSLSAGRWR